MTEIEFTLAEILAILTRTIFELQTEAISEFSELSLRQIFYLEAIGKLENPTPSELARKLGLSKPSVTAATDKLALEGYLQKVHSDADRRSLHLHLTEKGIQLTAAHEQVHEHIASTLTRGLDGEEVETLRKLLNKIVMTLS